jgi:hypothetical protein
MKSIGVLAGALVVLLSVDARSLKAGEARPEWKKDWERTVEAAKKEGQVVLYAGADRMAVFGDFQRRYPEIKLVGVPGNASQISQRVMSERRAGQYLADLYISSSGLAYEFYERKILDPIRPALILPEVVDESKWWGGRHVYHDDEKSYVFAFNGTVQNYFSHVQLLLGFFASQMEG